MKEPKFCKPWWTKDILLKVETTTLPWRNGEMRSSRRNVTQNDRLPGHQVWAPPGVIPEILLDLRTAEAPQEGVDRREVVETIMQEEMMSEAGSRTQLFEEVQQALRPDLQREGPDLRPVALRADRPRRYQRGVAEEPIKVAEDCPRETMMTGGTIDMRDALLKRRLTTEMTDVVGEDQRKGQNPREAIGTEEMIIETAGKADRGSI